VRVSTIGLLTAILLISFARPAAAVEFRQGDTVTVPAGETIADDLYAFGGTVSILGTVRGDVVAFGGTIIIDGNVTDDLIAAGGTVTVRGQVGGTVRVGSGRLVIDGSVGGDVVAGSGDVSLSSTGRIGRDLVAGSGSVSVAGQVARHVLVGSDGLTLAGAVGGNVDARVQTLVLADGASVQGSVTYTSAREATIDPGAEVGGGVERRAPPPVTERPGEAATPVLDWLRGLVGFLALGLLFVLLLPGLARRSREALTRSPLPSLAYGLAVLVGLPLLAILVFAVGALVGGWWLGLILLALYGIALLVSIPVAALYIGSWVLGRAGRPMAPAWGVAAGTAILLLVGLVPVLGGFVLFVAILFGLGALALAVASARREAPAAAA
jgi:cytoskeletal protein CcmA (bactofilin family)